MDAVVGIKFLVDASSLRQAEQEFKKSQSFLTSYQIQENEKRTRSAKSSSDKVVTAERETREKILALSRKYNQTEESLAKKNTYVLVAEGVKLVNAKKKLERDILEAADQRRRQDLQKEKQFLTQQIALYRQSAAQRTEVQRQGAGVGLGILGTGRNVTGKSGGFGAINFAAGATAVTAGIAGFKILYDHAKEADDAVDGLDIALAKVGVTGTKVRDEMLATGAVLADDFALRETEVNKLQAIVAGYGGQVGETNKQIVELAIANAASLGTSADALAKVFAKASDPENEAQLSRYGLTFAKGATETERWNAILERFGGAVETAKKTTRDGMGEATRVMNKLSDTIAKLANQAIQFLTPALSAIGDIISNVIVPAFEFAIPIFEKVWGIFYGLPGIIIQHWGTLKQFVSDALAWIKGAWESAKAFANDLSFGLIGQSREQMKAEKDAEARREKTAASVEAFNKKEVESNSAKVKAQIAEQEKLAAALDPTNPNFGKPAPEKQKGDTPEQKRKKLFDVAIDSIEREKKEGLLLEFEYLDKVIDATKKFHQEKEQLAAESTRRILEDQRIKELAYGIEPRGGQIGRLNLPGRTPRKTSTPGASADPDKRDLQSFANSITGLNGQELLDEEKWNRIKTAIDPLTQSIGALSQSFLEGGNAMKAFRDMFISSLTSMAASLMAKAAIFGILAILFPGSSVVAAGLPKFLGFSQGGVVPKYMASGGDLDATDKSIRMGGFISKFRKGRDIIPAMLEPKERVLSVAQNRRFEAMGGLSALNYGGKSIYQGGFISNSDAPPGESIYQGGFISLLDTRIAELANARGYMGGGGSASGGGMTAQQTAQIVSAIRSIPRTTVLDPWQNEQSKQMSNSSWDIATL